MTEIVRLCEFARRYGMRKGQAEHYCRKGLIAGATFDRLTWQWLIPLPARLLQAPEAKPPRPVSNEVPQVERRPRTEAELQPACPSLQTGLTGRPTYFADPYVQHCCRSIAAAVAELKNGGRP